MRIRFACFLSAAGSALVLLLSAGCLEVPMAKSIAGPAAGRPASAVPAWARGDVALSADGRRLARIESGTGGPTAVRIDEVEGPGKFVTVLLPAFKGPPGTLKLRWEESGKLVLAAEKAGMFVLDSGGEVFHPLDPAAPEAGWAADRLAEAASLVAIDPYGRQPIGRRPVAPGAAAIWTDPEIAAAQAATEEQLPDRKVFLLGWDRARMRFLLIARRPDGAQRIFVFSRGDARLTEFP